jgi:transcription elongation GreA/GreB family factor
VGSALKDRSVGEIVEVDIPSGKARYRIERIEHTG